MQINCHVCSCTVLKISVCSGSLECADLLVLQLSAREYEQAASLVRVVKTLVVGARSLSLEEAQIFNLIDGRPGSDFYAAHEGDGNFHAVLCRVREMGSE